MDEISIGCTGAPSPNQISAQSIDNLEASDDDDDDDTRSVVEPIGNLRNSYFFTVQDTGNNIGALVLHCSRHDQTRPERRLILHRTSDLQQQIPPEIWTDVIRAAVDIQDALRLSFDSILEARAVVIRISKEYQTSMTTKRNISTVSKLFHHLAIPYLFQYIRLRNLQHLRKVAEVIEVSRIRSNTQSFGFEIQGVTTAWDPEVNYGQFVRRIDMTPDKSFGADPVLTSHLLRRLLNQTPQLRNLYGDLPLSTGWVEVGVLQTLTQMQNLRRIALRCSTQRELNALSSFMYSGEFIRLQGFRLRVDQFTTTAASASDPASELQFKLDLPQLKGLCINLQNKQFVMSFPSWNLPKLCNVFICHPKLDLLHAFAPFFEKHAGTITSLALENMHESPAAIEQLCKPLINLQDLIYNPFLVQPWPSNYVSNSLRQISWSYEGHDPGDRETNGPLYQHERRDIEAHLYPILSGDRTPNLRVLQILSDNSSTYNEIKDEGEREWWRRAVRALEKRGIRFVDCEYEPIMGPGGRSISELD